MSGPSSVFKYLNTQSSVRYDQYEAVCRERDRARDVAVALEQELAALNLPAGHSPDPAGTGVTDPAEEGEAEAGSVANYSRPHRFRYDGTDEMYCRCGLPAGNWRHDVLIELTESQLSALDYRPRHAVTT